MKRLLIQLFYLSGIFYYFRWWNRNRVVILTYHGVLPSDHEINPYLSRNIVEQNRFDWQMEYLVRNYNCLRLSEVINRFSEGKKLLPYTAVVTFDDGFKNNYTYAFDILKNYGIPATIFLTTGFIGRGVKLLWTEKLSRMIYYSGNKSISVEGVSYPIDSEKGKRMASRKIRSLLKSKLFQEREEIITSIENQLIPTQSSREICSERYAFLDWDEVRVMERSLIEIGSHTVNHPILSSLNEDHRWDEVKQSKRHIEDRIESQCILFSYPNGTREDFTEIDKNHLKKAGYVGAVTQISGLNDPTSDYFELKRVNIGYGHDSLLFIAQVSGFLPWLRNSFKGISGMVRGLSDSP